MSNSPRQPRPDDAVLGGKSQVPIDGAVLGGIDGLRQRLATDNLEVKKVALSQALNYGEKGVEVLFEVLEKEKDLDIKWLAYQVLEKQNNSSIQVRLNNYFSCYEFEDIMLNRRGEIIKRIPGKARYFREELGKGICLDMTYIPGGTFLMGSPELEKDSQDNERPQHQVTVPPFWMGKYAITQAEYQAVMGNNPSKFKDNPQNPVESVTWYDAQAFCQKLKEITGKDFRLPTEAEWEYACRAGTTTAFYCGKPISTAQANYTFDYTYVRWHKGVSRNKTTPVGSFPANPWGLYDMAGNVYEWCADPWHGDYRDKPDSIKNNGNTIWLNSNESRRVLRGGSWAIYWRGCRSADRGCDTPSSRFGFFGFRVVCHFPTP